MPDLSFVSSPTSLPVQQTNLTRSPRCPQRPGARRAAAGPWAPSVVLAGLLVLLTACGGGSSPAEAAGAASAPPTSPPVNPPVNPTPSALACAGLPSAAQMLAAINNVRAGARTCGVAAYPAAAAMAWNNALATASQGHSDDMAAQNYFSHTSLDGRQFTQRASAAGYNGGAMAENLAAGQTTLQGTLNSWLGSPDHCANLMNPVYKDVALACASKTGTNFGSYWTLMVGAPR